MDIETQSTAQEPGLLLTGDMTALVDSTSMNSTASMDITVSYADEQGITKDARESVSSIINCSEEDRDVNAENAKKAEEARGYLRQYLITTSPDDRTEIVKKLIQTQDVKTISEAFNETPYAPGNPIARLLINALIALKACPPLVENFAYMTRDTEDYNLVVEAIAKHGNVGEIFELMQLVTAGTREDNSLVIALADRGVTFEQLMQEARVKAKRS